MLNGEQIIRKLAELFGVRVYFFNRGDDGVLGWYNPRTQAIRISRGKTSEMISTFFHELGHRYCYDMGIWKDYHRINYKNGRPVFTVKQLKGILKNGLKAERWVDKWGEKMMNTMFPMLPYRKGYVSKEAVRWYQQEHLSWYRYKLRKKLEYERNKAFA